MRFLSSPTTWLRWWSPKTAWPCWRDWELWGSWVYLFWCPSSSHLELKGYFERTGLQSGGLLWLKWQMKIKLNFFLSCCWWPDETGQSTSVTLLLAAVKWEISARGIFKRTETLKCLHYLHVRLGDPKPLSLGSGPHARGELRSTSSA